MQYIYTVHNISFLNRFLRYVASGVLKIFERGKGEHITTIKYA